MEQKSKLYALLVGINNYSYVTGLNGCEHDAVRIQQYLETNLTDRFELRLHPLLLSGQATKANIVDAFEKHLIGSEAQPGDVLLFYFSGHGAEEAAHEVFWPAESNRKLQVYACADATLNSTGFLADKELRYLLHRAAKPGVEIVVITDCCHAGDATRAFPSEDLAERRLPGIKMRDWKDFIFAHALQPGDLGGRSLDEAMPQAPHYHLAACRSHESSWEQGEKGGVFTTALLKALDHSKGNISYQELKDKIAAHINREFVQSPQLYMVLPSVEDLGSEMEQRDAWRNAPFKTFLGNAFKDKPLKAQVYFNKALQSWVLDKGAIYGVRKTWDGTTQQVAVRVGRNAVLPATIETVYSGFSTVLFEPYADVLRSERYEAVVPSLVKRILPIGLQGEADGIAAFQGNFSEKTLYDAGLRLVANIEAAEYIVWAKGGGYWIAKPNSEAPLTTEIKGYNNPRLLADLEKISRWMFAKNLRYEEPSALSGAVSLAFFEGNEQLPVVDGKLALKLKGTDLKGRAMTNIRMQVVNHSQRPLYVEVLYLADNFGISPIRREGGPVRMDGPTNSFLITNGGKQQFNLWMDEYPGLPRTSPQYVRLLLLYSPIEFEATLLAQKGLEAPVDGVMRKTIDLDRNDLSPDWQAVLYEISMEDAR